MHVGTAIFVIGVIYFLVVSPGFRRVTFIGVVLFMLFALYSYYSDYERKYGSNAAGDPDPRPSYNCEADADKPFSAKPLDELERCASWPPCSALHPTHCDSNPPWGNK
jgi:hypothetical protein